MGDRRWRDRDGILEILASAFAGVVVANIHLSRRLKPQQLWLWFLDMYDLYFLGEADRKLVEQDFLSAVAPGSGPDGTLEFPQTLRFVSATTA
jgi:hypothetical protein